MIQVSQVPNLRNLNLAIEILIDNGICYGR